MAGVAQVEVAAPGEGLRRAAAACRQDAIEHVDAAPHRADDVGGPADAHQVARPVGRQHRHGDVEDGEHHLLAFAGLERMKAAYAHAINRRYRFYSYGDCCLLHR